MKVEFLLFTLLAAIEAATTNTTVLPKVTANATEAAKAQNPLTTPTVAKNLSIDSSSSTTVVKSTDAQSSWNIALVLLIVIVINVTLLILARLYKLITQKLSEALNIRKERNQKLWEAELKIRRQIRREHRMGEKSIVIRNEKQDEEALIQPVELTSRDMPLNWQNQQIMYTPELSVESREKVLPKQNIVTLMVERAESELLMQKILDENDRNVETPKSINQFSQNEFEEKQLSKGKVLEEDSLDLQLEQVETKVEINKIQPLSKFNQEVVEKVNSQLVQKTSPIRVVKSDSKQSSRATSKLKKQQAKIIQVLPQNKNKISSVKSTANKKNLQRIQPTPVAEVHNELEMSILTQCMDSPESRLDVQHVLNQQRQLPVEKGSGVIDEASVKSQRASAQYPLQIKYSAQISQRDLPVENSSSRENPDFEQLRNDISKSKIRQYQSIGPEMQEYQLSGLLNFTASNQNDFTKARYSDLMQQQSINQGERLQFLQIGRTPQQSNGQKYGQSIMFEDKSQLKSFNKTVQSPFKNSTSSLDELSQERSQEKKKLKKKKKTGTQKRSTFQKAATMTLKVESPIMQESERSPQDIRTRTPPDLVGSTHQQKVLPKIFIEDTEELGNRNNVMDNDPTQDGDSVMRYTKEPTDASNNNWYKSQSVPETNIQGGSVVDFSRLQSLGMGKLATKIGENLQSKVAAQMAKYEQPVKLKVMSKKEIKNMKNQFSAFFQEPKTKAQALAALHR